MLCLKKLGKIYLFNSLRSIFLRNECELARTRNAFEEKLSKLKEQQHSTKKNEFSLIFWGLKLYENEPIFSYYLTILDESQLLEFQIKSLEEV